MVATEITDYEAAQKIFGPMGEGILKRVLLAFQFLLHAIKEFVADNRRIKSGDGDWLPGTATLVVVII